MSLILADADQAWSCEQYAVLRREFISETFGIPGVREYRRGTLGAGDIDSGPIVLGYSGPAIVVGMGAARGHGDLQTARRLLGLIEVIGLPLDFAGRRAYAAGTLPIGDAFLAWARTIPVPANRKCVDAPESPLTGRWVLLLQVLSAGILVASFRMTLDSRLTWLPWMHVRRE